MTINYSEACICNEALLFPSPLKRVTSSDPQGTTLTLPSPSNDVILNPNIT